MSAPPIIPEPDDLPALLAELRALTAELARRDAQAPIVEVASEDGICYCPTCGAIIRVVPRPHRHPHVVDADGREHLCERYIAAVFARAHVAGMRELRDSHLERPVIAGPLGPDGRPSRARAPTEAQDTDVQPIWETGDA